MMKVKDYQVILSLKVFQKIDIYIKSFYFLFMGEA